MNDSTISARVERNGIDHYGDPKASEVALDLVVEFLHALADGTVEDPCSSAKELLRVEHLLEDLRARRPESPWYS